MMSDFSLVRKLFRRNMTIFLLSAAMVTVILFLGADVYFTWRRESGNANAERFYSTHTRLEAYYTSKQQEEVEYDRILQEGIVQDGVILSLQMMNAGSEVTVFLSNGNALQLPEAGENEVVAFYNGEEPLPENFVTATEEIPTKWMSEAGRFLGGDYDAAPGARPSRWIIVDQRGDFWRWQQQVTERNYTEYIRSSFIHSENDRGIADFTNRASISYFTVRPSPDRFYSDLDFLKWYILPLMITAALSFALLLWIIFRGILQKEKPILMIHGALGARRTQLLRYGMASFLWVILPSLIINFVIIFLRGDFFTIRSVIMLAAHLVLLFVVFLCLLTAVSTWKVSESAKATR